MNSSWRTWEEVKAEADALDPRSPEEKAAGKAAARAATDAYILGYELSEIRKALKLTQAHVAEGMGVSQARISKIEHGDISGLEIIRAYVQALGGSVEVVATIGDRAWTLNGRPVSERPSRDDRAAGDRAL